MDRLALRHLLVAAALCTVAPAIVAEEPLVTDRPDFTESSSTVGRGVLQLDFRVARRLGDSGADVLVGTGISWRLGG